MAFDPIEKSIESGRPVEFYTFDLGTLVWRYTTAEEDQLVGVNLFKSAAIISSNVKQTGEVSSDALSLDTPSWIAPAQMFMTAAPTRGIQVSIAVKHVGDTEMIVSYVGEISQVNFPMPGKAIITVESLMSSMSREGLRLGWQRTCPYALYDPVTCKVNKTTHKVALTVLSIDGFDILVALATSKPAGHFNGGFLEWTHPIRGLEYLAIEKHVVASTLGANAKLSLFGPPGELFEGATGDAFPGCDFLPTTCQTKFANYDNYGGTPDMPGRSPFDGNPVFY